MGGGRRGKGKKRKGGRCGKNGKWIKRTPAERAANKARRQAERKARKQRLKESAESGRTTKRYKPKKGCGPFGCKPEPVIPNWGKMQGKKKQKKKKNKRPDGKPWSCGGKKRGSWGVKCRLWRARGCRINKKDKKCRDNWSKKNPLPAPKPRAKVWRVLDGIWNSGGCKKNFNEYCKGHGGFEMVMDGTLSMKGQLLSRCGSSSAKGGEKRMCEGTVKKVVKRWMSKQENLWKSGDPACAKTALVKGGMDGNVLSPKKKKKSKKPKKKAWKPKKAGKPKYRKRSYKAGKRRR